MSTMYRVIVEESFQTSSGTTQTTSRVEFSTTEDDARGLNFGHMIGRVINAFHCQLPYQGNVVDSIVKALPRPLERRGD